MHLLFTDETNTDDASDADFFIYGGLIVPAISLKEMHDGMAAIRKAAGYKAEDKFKFQLKSRPSHVSIEAFNGAKASVISLCYRLGCHFIVYAFLKATKGDTSTDQMVAFGANSVLETFNRYLTQNKSFGIAISDRLAKESHYPHMQEKFTKGLLYKGQPPKPLSNIGVFAGSCINASHAASAIDIVLGAFRYCVNYPKNEEIAKQIMSEVAALIWHTRDGEVIRTDGMGLILRPQGVFVPKFRQQQEKFVERLNALIRDVDIAPPMPSVQGLITKS